MLEHSVEAFDRASRLTGIVVVLPAAYVDRMGALLVAFPKVQSVVPGGPTRQLSRACGLAALGPGTQVVAVHDAARPMIDAATVDRVAAGVGDGYHGAVCAIPLDDAVKAVGDAGEILEPRSRAGLWRAQTPQAFERACLEDSLARALTDGVTCDDCSEMATRAGYRVRVVLGDRRNLKVTRQADLDLCEALLAGQA